MRRAKKFLGRLRLPPVPHPGPRQEHHNRPSCASYSPRLTLPSTESLLRGLNVFREHPGIQFSRAAHHTTFRPGPEQDNVVGSGSLAMLRIAARDRKARGLHFL